MRKLICISLILSQFILGCSSDDDSNDSGDITIDAKVVKAGGGPCSFLIQLMGDSEIYLLDEIPEEFKVDNLQVHLTYRDNNSIFSCSGFLDAREIEIVDIEQID